MASLYDLEGIHRYLKRHRNDKAKKEYIDSEMRKMKERGSGSLYDLNNVARITKIYNEARDKYD